MLITTKRPYWRNRTTWICPLHLPSAKIHYTVTQCFFSGCKSVRPEIKLEKPKLVTSKKEVQVKIKKLVENERRTCSLEGCDELVKSKRKKYCSDKCRKDYARKAYVERLRKKQRKNGK